MSSAARSFAEGSEGMTEPSATRSLSIDAPGVDGGTHGHGL
jgi:hypothetical protein